MTRADTRRSTPRRVVAALVGVLALAGAACTSKGPTSNEGSAAGDPTGCLVVPLTTSPEKVDFITELARQFNQKRLEVNGACVFVDPKRRSSGEAMGLLANGWDEGTEGPRPVVWTPAGSAWGAILDQRLSEKGQKAMAGQGTPFMNTPLVIAMPKPMAEALGWPGTPIGWSDILTLARDPAGWAAKGHPEWGPFRLGKTNPNYSTSGLSALVAQNYAAAGKTRDLTSEDLDRAEVQAFDREVESLVVHYGDTTLTFLNNWYRSDQRGAPYAYASAVAVEEKSVIDYNAGNPDGIASPGEEPRPPRIPLVAIYPKEGTLFSDHPFFVLDAPWVRPEQKQAAKLFSDFVQQADNQKKALAYGFRPGNPQVPLADPISLTNGVDPTQPATLLPVPPPAVMGKLLVRWHDQRKGARVLLVLDVSGSMGDPGAGKKTKLDLAKDAALDSLSEFTDDDLVGLRVFSTLLGPDRRATYLDLVPVDRLGTVREQLRTAISNLQPTNGTPLYDVALASYTAAAQGYDTSRINAVVLLTDGLNEDGDPSNDSKQLDTLLATLQAQARGETATPVRLFTIGYGADADQNVLRTLAEAANGAAYNASDPRSIAKVFAQVISNF